MAVPEVRRRSAPIVSQIIGLGVNLERAFRLRTARKTHPAKNVTALRPVWLVGERTAAAWSIRLHDYSTPADNQVFLPAYPLDLDHRLKAELQQAAGLTALKRHAMFDGNVYYCWFCDAHRRGIPGAAGTQICPRCDKDLSENSRLARLSVAAAPGEAERRPIFAMSIGHPVPNSSPAWSGNVAAAS